MSYFKALQCWQIFISLAFITYTVGCIGITLLSVVLLLYETIGNLRKKTAVWLCTLVHLLLLCLFENFEHKDAILENLHMTRHHYYLLLLAVHWIILRCTSYYIDLIDYKREHIFLQTLAYCLYLPLLFFGPFVNFEDFNKNYSCRSFNHNRKTELLINMIRFGFWLIFLEFILHFIYVNAVAFQPQVVYRKCCSLEYPKSCCSLSNHSIPGAYTATDIAWASFFT